MSHQVPEARKVDIGDEVEKVTQTYHTIASVLNVEEFLSVRPMYVIIYGIATTRSAYTAILTAVEHAQKHMVEPWQRINRARLTR